MRKVFLSGAIALVVTFPALCSAQVSTFPAPPPLPAPARSTSDSVPNNAPSSPTPSVDLTAPSNAPSSAPPVPAEPSSPIPVTAATLNTMTALDDKVTLQPGDRISFRVIEDRDEAVPRIVTDTGEVDFPYVGRVRVQGLTCHEVAVQLKRLLEVDYYKSATVIVGLDVIATHPENIAPKEMAWVIGQVRTVGPQELSPLQPMTVSQIILRAGGFGDFADQRRVRIIHRARPTASNNPDPIPDNADAEIIDVKSVFDGHSTVDPIVKPNDYIIVPKRVFNY